MVNTLADELNTLIRDEAPPVASLLSELGRHLYFPRGILSQSAEAKRKATRFNATIGIATEGGEGMHLACVKKYFNDLETDEIFTYAPSFGIPALRERWKKKIREETPSLGDGCISTPVVTHALTHGLSVAADMFVDPGDLLILPDKMWGNYTLMFKVRKKAEFLHFPFFDGKRFNVAGLAKTLREASEKRKKLVVLLNFPNNPTGYAPTVKEADEIARVLEETAAGGTQMVVLVDDAYYGLFYEEETLKESVFGRLAGLHENLLAVKVDGATKELYMWGFRVGFLTFGVKGGSPALYEALEKKAAGAVRGSISNCSKVAQNIVLKVLDDPDLAAQREEKYLLMRERFLAVKEVLSDERFDTVWDAYPFNAGYFMCLRLKEADPEKCRLHLLDKYATGIIAANENDVRIAFSCLEREQIPEMFEILFTAAREVS